jgi:hypothetical protein
MRLYAICKTDKYPFYISSHVKVRSALPSSFYLTCPYGHTHGYNPNEIFAETTEENTVIGGALAGGLIGLLAGGAGAILGLLTGGLLGGKREMQDKEAVERFNRSKW